MHISREQMGNYVSGRTQPQDEVHLERHLEHCIDCQAELETLAGPINELGTQIHSLPRQQSEFFLEEDGLKNMLTEIVRFPESGVPPLENSSPSLVDSPVPPTAPALPQVWGEYEVVAKIGEGGMGAVYRAVHTRLGKTFALKLLASHRSHTPEIAARFEREVRAIGQLDHPHIVNATDAREVDGVRFLVMEFVDGVDLNKLLERRGPLPTAEACEMIRQAAEGLDYVHSRNFVHRDIKPSNLMLTSPRRTGDVSIVKILDLGLARLADVTEAEQHELTADGQVLGTLDYMAPEQGSSGRIDTAADVYSLGATLYKLLSGRAPLQADPAEPRKSILQKLTALATERPAPLAEVCGTCPPALSELVDRMLAKAPGDRPSLREVITAIAPFAAGADLTRLMTDGQPEGANPWDASPSSAMANSIAKGNIHAAPTSTRAHWLSFHRLVASALLLFVFGGIAAGVVVIIRKNDGTKERIALKAGERLEIDDQGAAKIVQPSVPPPVDEQTIGRPLSTFALVRTPAKLPNVDSWTIETRTPRGATYWAEFRPDGRQLATLGEDCVVRILDLDTGKIVRCLVTPGSVANNGHAQHPLGWSADGQYLALAMNMQGLIVWKAETGEVAFEDLTLIGLNVTWHPQKNLVACNRENQGVTIIDAETGDKRDQFSRTGGVTGSMVFPIWSPAGDRIAIAVSPSGAFSAQVDIWNIEARQIERTLKPSDPSRSSPDGFPLAWSPDGSRIALVGWHGGPGFRGKVNGSSVRVWNVASGEEEFVAPFEVAGHQPISGGLRWSADGTQLIHGFGTLDARTGEPLSVRQELLRQELSEPRQQCVGISPDGSRFVMQHVNTSASGGIILATTVQLWEAGQTQPIKRLSQNALGWQEFIEWHSDTKLHSFQGMWDVATGTRIAAKSPETLKLHYTYDIPSPDGQRFLRPASGRWSIIHATEVTAPVVIDIEGNPKFTPGGFFRWSFDGKWVISHGNHKDDLITVWNAKTGKRHAEFNRQIYVWNDVVFGRGKDPNGGAAIYPFDAAEAQIALEKAQQIELPIHGYLTSFTRGKSQDSFRVNSNYTPEWCDFDLKTGAILARGTYDVYRPRTLSPGGNFDHSSGVAPGAVMVYSFAADRLLGGLVSLAGDNEMSISPEGHVTSNYGRFRDELVYIVKQGDVQRTLTPEEFATEFGWQNQPEKCWFQFK